jgi:hypothetical protein
MKIYRNVKIKGKKITGESSFDRGKNWFRFEGNKDLMKISEGMENTKAFNQIWNIVRKRYGLTEFDWSFIRDEEDNKLIKKYLKIVSKYHKGKYGWETSAKKKLSKIV